MTMTLPAAPRALTALLIDDDAHSLYAISQILSDLGVRFKRNTSGARCVPQAAAMQPDVILLDLDLPATNALLALRQIRHDPALRNTPIIALTDAGCAELANPAIGHGAFAVLHKPFTRQQLAALLDQLPVRPNADTTS